MLSGETAKGNFPMEALEMMSNACREAEKAIDYENPFKELRRLSLDGMAQESAYSKDRRSCCCRCREASELDAAAIIVMTKGGDTAKAVAKYRPSCPIVAVVANEKVANAVLLSRGVIPLLFDDKIVSNSEYAIEKATQSLTDMGIYSESSGRRLIAITGRSGQLCDDSDRRELILL